MKELLLCKDCLMMRDIVEMLSHIFPSRVVHVRPGLLANKGKLGFPRYRPDVRGKDIKMPKITVSTVKQNIFEQPTEFAGVIPAVDYQTCSLIRAGHNPALRVASVTVVPTLECELEAKSAKNTKYFCITCNLTVCNSCFSVSCLAHKVQWIPYSPNFTCLSLHHDA